LKALLWDHGGQGVLIYPGPDFEVIPCMRLASVRDGLEDYEYFKMLHDLARYLRQGSLSSRSLLSFDGQRVTSEHKDSRTKDASGRAFRRRLTLPVEEFLQRVLLHVPFPGAHYSRAFGLYASTKRDQLGAARAKLGQDPASPIEPLTAEEYARELEGDTFNRCPACGEPLEAIRLITPSRSPPVPRESAA